MLKSGFPLKKIIAAILPISFIWLFVACMVICTMECTETCVDEAAISVVEITDGADCRACPLEALPTITLPQRATLHSEWRTPVIVAALVIAASSPIDDFASVPGYAPSPFADPPLCRLPLLRI